MSGEEVTTADIEAAMEASVCGCGHPLAYHAASEVNGPRDGKCYGRARYGADGKLLPRGECACTSASLPGKEG